jgi:hypothetical protein
MTNLPDQITELYASTKGDPSVGISGESALIKADGDFLIDIKAIPVDDRVPTLEEFRAKLEEAFAVVWEDPVVVRFGFELAAKD